MFLDFNKPFWISILWVGAYLSLHMHQVLAKDASQTLSLIELGYLEDDHTINTLLSSSAPHQTDTIKTFSLTAVGDLMMGTNFPSESYLPPDSGHALWAEVGPILRSSQVTFGNLEGVILSKGGEMKECQNPKNCYLFRTPDDLSFHFKNNGFCIK